MKNLKFIKQPKKTRTVKQNNSQTIDIGYLPKEVPRKLSKAVKRSKAMDDIVRRDKKYYGENGRIHYYSDNLKDISCLSPAKGKHGKITSNVIDMYYRLLSRSGNKAQKKKVLVLLSILFYRLYDSIDKMSSANASLFDLGVKLNYHQNWIENTYQSRNQYQKVKCF